MTAAAVPTLGPWAVEAWSPYEWGVTSPSGPVASRIHSAMDARLIAQAPAMLDTLRTALPLFERAALDEKRANRAPTGLPPCTVAWDRWIAARDLLRAVEG